MIVKEAPTSRPAHPAQTARRLRVLLVTDHLGHAGGVIHGASRYYLQTLPRLDRSRFDVTLCILGQHHPFAHALEQAGVHPIFLNRAKWDPRALADLLRLVRAANPDVLHCLAMKGCLFGRIAGRARGIPSLIHLHDTNDPGRLIGFVQRRLARWTHRALAVSSAVREYTSTQLAIPAERIEILYNGLDLDAFAHPAPDARPRIRRSLDIDPAAVVILVAGRVVESKGQRLLVGLLPRILDACPRARLLIAGDGADLRECRQLADRLGVQHAVSTPGQREDMPDIIAASDIATMPSLQPEGFGFAAVEASAGARPVVAFSGGSLSEVVENGRTGILVPSGDGDGMAQALVQLAADPQRARTMGRAGAVFARRFAIQQHVERLEQIYHELARARPLHPPACGVFDDVVPSTELGKELA